MNKNAQSKFRVSLILMFVFSAAVSASLLKAQNEASSPTVEVFEIIRREDAVLADEESGISAKIELRIPKEEQIREEITKDAGGNEHYNFYVDEKKMPSGFHKGASYLKSITLTWNGKAILFPAAVIEDLAGLDIQELKQLRDPRDDGEKTMLENQLEYLRLPKLVVSADKQTVMIEWERAEECDGKSVFRWITNKDGQVLRHRVTSGGEG